MELNRDVDRNGGPEPGVSGERLRDAGLRRLIALCLLSVGLGLQATGLVLLGPFISASLGIGMGRGPQFFAFEYDLLAVAAIIAAMGTAAIIHRWRPSPSRIVLPVGMLWAVALMLESIVITANWMLIAGLLVAGGAAGAMLTMQWPLLFDSFTAGVRFRAYRIHTAVLALSSSTASLVVYMVMFHSSWTWRVALLIMGLIVFLCVAIAQRLSEPGARSTSKLVKAAAAGPNAAGSPAMESGPGGSSRPVDPETAVGFFEELRQVVTIPSARLALTLLLIFGLVTVPMAGPVRYYLEARWALAQGRQVALLGLLFLAPLPILALLGWTRRGGGPGDSSRHLRIAAEAALLGSAAAGVAALVPSWAVMVACLAIALGSFYAAVPGACLVLFSVVHPGHRGSAGALAAAGLAVGALVGPSLSGGFYTRFGTHWALLVLDLACIALAGGVYRHAGVVRADMSTIRARVDEAMLHSTLLAGGQHFPLLSCRHVDFSYGSLQVLFGVDLSVEDGEMVALLGTNGAGKSTLLRVICGLGFPSGGTVQFGGRDISYVPSARRVGLGISQVPGGRAVFGPMSVVDNLRVYAYSLGRHRSTVDTQIGRVLDTFPSLADRRNQLASTLSGGEQQMLALGKAILLRPRLLAIDELSLGLAPIITGQLLEMVRQINSEGTAVILVEQSINIALSLVDHAYFMEKGQMRFDGSAHDLIGRDDILRAVFLPRMPEQES